MRLLKIGRDAACDIVLYSENVSSLHAELTLLNSIHRLPGDTNRFSKGFLRHILLCSCNFDSDIPCDMKHPLHDGWYHKDD